MEVADSADVVLLDLRPGDTDALHTLRWASQGQPLGSNRSPISRTTHTRSAGRTAVGARQCLTKPVAQRDFEAVMKQQLEKSTDRASGKSAEEQIDFIADDCAFVSASPAMHKIRMQAEVLAKLDVPVFITGESGSGKEALARLLHKLSHR